MAEQTHGTIEIEASPKEIMAVIVDFEAYPEWASAVKKVEIRERDAGGRGKKVYYEVSQGPIKAQYVLEYTYKADDAGCSWKFVEGNTMRDLTGDYELEPGGDETTVTYTAKMELAIPMPGFLKRQGERMLIDTALKGLKKRVESLG